ncbi:hypothetical protein [Vibrio salinus]|uniref:hypothetical protein n=1 Tax=Vibrio salinus TaxID=2899784 RepID=UPI001E4DF892|nr:hypothetical protein [Vibrio salinus]MCE0495561.1 hypothetical protein [Vibrio salinus]
MKFGKMFVRDSWVTEKKFVHEKSGPYDTYRKKDLAFFRKLTITVPVIYQDTNWYPLFFLFKNGGREVFSGYFRPDVIVGAGGNTLKADGYLNLYNSVKGQKVILSREKQGRSLRNIHLKKDIYIYFGEKKLQSVGDVDYIVDSGVSASVQNKLENVISRVISQYSKILGQKLGQNVLVFLMLESGNTDLDLDGEVTNYQVNLKMTGEFNADKPFNSKFLHLIAHELSHLWNADLYTNRGPGWLHEGSADYFSTYLLRKLNLINASTYNRIVSGALNTCASQAGQHSLSESDVNDMVYGCGAVVHYSVDNYCGFGCSARLWKTLFANRSFEKNYDQKSWLRAFKSAVQNDKFYKKVSDFIQEPVKVSDIENVYRGLGWNLLKKPFPENKKRFFSSFKMLYHLMNSDCSGSFAYTMQSDMTFQLMNTSDCHTFKEGKVTQLDRQSIGSYSLYREIKQKCDNGGTVMVGTIKGQSYSYVCHAKLPDLPPYFEIP